jgi:hypothetical protein
MNVVNMQGKLSRAEMKNIMAGSGDCCWHTAGWTQSQCGMSSGDAQAVAAAYALASGQHSYWCCSSC